MNSDALMSVATLCMMWWVYSSQARRITMLEQQLTWAFQRKLREHILLLECKAHLRIFAKAVSKIEMSAHGAGTVLVTLDTFARDHLYGLVGKLEEYTPENVAEVEGVER